MMADTLQSFHHRHDQSFGAAAAAPRPGMQSACGRGEETLRGVVGIAHPVTAEPGSKQLAVDEHVCAQEYVIMTAQTDSGLRR